MKTIKKIDVKSIALPARKRVAAYARVSMESDRLILCQLRSATTTISFRIILNGNLLEYMPTVSSPVQVLSAEPSLNECFRIVRTVRLT